MGVVFPTAGLEKTCEFGRQPSNTAPDGQNVRSTETLTLRARGGSRAGLSRYINDLVNGASVVQHLNILVDPTTPALDSDDASGAVADPSTNNLSVRNPGRFVRAGGSGRQPNRQRPQQANPIEFVQGYRHQPGNVSGDYTLDLPFTPGLQNLLVVICRTSAGGSTAVDATAVKNANLNSFTQVGGSGYAAEVTVVTGPSAQTDQLTMWYRVANAGSPDSTVRVTVASTAIIEIVVLEYRNASKVNPLSNQVKGDSPTDADTFSVGPLAMNDTFGQAVVAAFTKSNTSASVSSGGYVPRYGIAGSGSADTAVIEKSGVSGATPENPAVTPFTPSPYCGIAAALTR